MSVAVLELNDCGLTIATAAGGRATSPGYATMQTEVTIVGDAAREQARLNPRQTNSQFWMRLGTTPLPQAQGPVRHHADLAWLHLRHLHEKAGWPGELVLAVPGSLSREQLGVLLGIAQRCDFRAVGLVDAALAATTTTPVGDAALHIDLHLHQCVLTRFARENDQLVRTAVTVLPDFGLVQLHDRWARSIAHAFIQQTRFDPLHAAGAEQQLYDSLPQWLHPLRTQDTAAVELRNGGNTYQTSLRLADFLDAAAPLYTHIADAAAAEEASTTLVLASRLAGLPRLVDRLADAVVLDADAVTRGCTAQLGAIRSDAAALRFVTRLAAPALRRHGEPATTPPPAPARTPGELPGAGAPTHVVTGRRAYALHGASLFLEARGDTCVLVPVVPAEPLCSFTRDDGGWWLSPAGGERIELDGMLVRRTTRLAAGQRISLPGRRAELWLVEEIRGPGDGA